MEYSRLRFCTNAKLMHFHITTGNKAIIRLYGSLFILGGGGSEARIFSLKVESGTDTGIWYMAGYKYICSLMQDSTRHAKVLLAVNVILFMNCKELYIVQQLA